MRRRRAWRRESVPVKLSFACHMVRHDTYNTQNYCFLLKNTQKNSKTFPHEGFRPTPGSLLGYWDCCFCGVWGVPLSWFVWVFFCFMPLFRFLVLLLSFVVLWLLFIVVFCYLCLLVCFIFCCCILLIYSIVLFSRFIVVFICFVVL